MRLEGQEQGSSLSLLDMLQVLRSHRYSRDRVQGGITSSGSFIDRGVPLTRLVHLKGFWRAMSHDVTDAPGAGLIAALMRISVACDALCCLSVLL